MQLVSLPFNHFFQSLSVQAFISAACGGAIGFAVLNWLMKIITTKNFQIITMNMDDLNNNLRYIEKGQLNKMIEHQMFLVSFKEIYGYLVIAGVFFLIFLILYRYPYFPKNLIYPRTKTIKKIIQKEIS